MFEVSTEHFDKDSYRIYIPTKFIMNQDLKRVMTQIQNNQNEESRKYVETNPQNNKPIFKIGNPAVVI